MGYVSGVEYLNGMTIQQTSQVLSLDRSPFHVRGDIDILDNGRLVVEPGVKLFFEPGVGISVRKGGTLIAEVWYSTI
jgi:hypothetical protein